MLSCSRREIRDEKQRKEACGGEGGTRQRREDLEDVDLDHPEPTVAQFCPVLDLALSSAQKVSWDSPVQPFKLEKES